MAAQSYTCPRCQIAFQAESSPAPQCPACKQAIAAGPGWFYASNKQKFGPVTIQQLQLLAGAGRLQPSDMVMQEGTTVWLKAESVPGLFVVRAKAVAPAAAARTEALSAQPSVRPSRIDPANAPTVHQQGSPKANGPTAPVKKPQPVSEDFSFLKGITANEKTNPAPIKAPEGDGSLPTVPGYTILEELGRGGMGVVYKAKQVGLNRAVALKMILAGNQDVTRFRSEGEAVARLHHPNIVQIYEVGETAGRPYFSLEFVEGGSLAQRLDGAPMPARQAAEIVQQLAQAMHYAHQQNIIHRDLKPANVLIAEAHAAGASKSTQPTSGARKDDTKGSQQNSGTKNEAAVAPLVPKITDFGLAKQLDSESGQTRSGAILGTPSYMAPEQAAGKGEALGPLVDVYALGAILYELLTGRPPFRGENAMDTMFQVITEDPVPPTRLRPKVPRDLETIVLKCLEKNPARRYPSAEVLAQDIDLYLKGEPISARPVSITERSIKWSRRRPAAAALVAVCAFGAGIMLLGSWWFTVSMAWERSKAEKAAKEARAAEARSRAGFQMRVEELDKLIARIDQRLANAEGTESIRMEFLTEFLRSAEMLLKEYPQEPAVRHQTALIHRLLGDGHMFFEDYADAMESYQKALQLRKPLVDELPNKLEYRNELATAYWNLAEVQTAQEKYTDALPNYRAALKLLEELAAQPTDQIDYRARVVSCRNDFGYCLYWAGQAKDAEPVLLEALKLQEELIKSDPSKSLSHSDLGITLRNLGYAVSRAQPPQAQAYFERGVTAQKKAIEMEPNRSLYRRRLFNTYKALGDILKKQGMQPELAKLNETIRREFPNTDNTARPSTGTAHAEIKVGQPAPEITGKDIENETLRLSNYRGKVVVLDFWADYCGYCRRMYGQERLLEQSMRGRPFAMLGVNSDPSRSTARNVMKQERLNWKSFYDADGAIGREWRVAGIPAIFVIDHKGVIRHIFRGVPDKGALETAVERLVKEAEQKR